MILLVPGIFLLKILCVRKSNYLKAFLTIEGPLFLFLLFIFFNDFIMHVLKS